MANFSVFASGRGSNFKAIHQAFADSHHKLVCLVSDKAGCPAVAYAVDQGIPVVIVSYKAGSRELAEAGYHDAHKKYAVDFVVLAGYMRLLSADFVQRYENKIINIHPSLLPAYPGVDSIKRAFEAGEQYLGITIHYVDSGIDTGPVIYQESFERLPAMDLDEVEERVHNIEHRAYPEVLAVIFDTGPSK